ncbi:hypothetical protein JCM14036_16470 [Desulfotomaculum defluvii]
MKEYQVDKMLPVGLDPGPPGPLVALAALLELEVAQNPVQRMDRCSHQATLGKVLYEGWSR